MNGAIFCFLMSPDSLSSIQMVEQEFIDDQVNDLQIVASNSMTDLVVVVSWFGVAYLRVTGLIS